MGGRGRGRAEADAGGGAPGARAGARVRAGRRATRVYRWAADAWERHGWGAGTRRARQRGGLCVPGAAAIDGEGTAVGLAREAQGPCYIIGLEPVSARPKFTLLYFTLSRSALSKVNARAEDVARRPRARRTQVRRTGAEATRGQRASDDTATRCSKSYPGKCVPRARVVHHCSHRA